MTYLGVEQEWTGCLFISQRQFHAHFLRENYFFCQLPSKVPTRQNPPAKHSTSVTAFHGGYIANANPVFSKTSFLFFPDIKAFFCVLSFDAKEPEWCTTGNAPSHNFMLVFFPATVTQCTSAMKPLLMQCAITANWGRASVLPSFFLYPSHF